MRTRPCARFASWPTLSIARYLICSNRETKGIALGNNDWAEVCTYIDGEEVVIFKNNEPDKTGKVAAGFRGAVWVLDNGKPRK